MDQTDKFESSALKVNLKKTEFSKKEFSADETWFLELTQERFGLNETALNFLSELHHPYPNIEEVLEGLRKIALTDIWFYKGVPDRERALLFILALFRQFFSLDMTDGARERGVRSVMEFVGALEGTGKNEGAPANVAAVAVACIGEQLGRGRDILVHASAFLKKFPIDLLSKRTATDVSGLLEGALRANLVYWRDSVDFDRWFGQFHEGGAYGSDSITALMNRHFPPTVYAQLERQLRKTTTFERLREMADHDYFTAKMRAIVDELDSPVDRVYFIFYLFQLPGMKKLQDHLLWDLNRVLRQVEIGDDPQGFLSFLEELFGFFKKIKALYASTVLDCVLTLGKYIYSAENRDVVLFFIDRIVDTGFVQPRVRGIGDNWQIRVDRNHIKNIRVWLELIEIDPALSLKLLSALIIHLKTGGVFIADTDLFQRDITKLLNSNVSCCYKIVKQLTSLFPVYFNEIGAEGELRDITTIIDEISCRRDLLVHFLRKQVHSESNNTHVELARKIFYYWYTGDKEPLLPYIPADVAAWLASDGEWFGGVHQLTVALCRRFGCESGEIFSLPLEEIQQAVTSVEGTADTDRKRVLSLLQLHAMLREKYSFDAVDIISHLSNLSLLKLEDIQRLKDMLKDDRDEEALELIFLLLKQLKAVILDPKTSKGFEDIYHKRHIAAGIPSMYGQYREPKFEALGMSFRLERLAEILMERIVRRADIKYISARTLKRIARILDLFKEGLELSGISSESFNSSLEMFHYSLSTPSFSIHQFINIFQFMLRDLRAFIKQYFVSPHETNVKTILRQYTLEGNREKLSCKYVAHQVQKQAESFYRGLVASAFLVQQLDGFTGRVLDVMRTMQDELDAQLIAHMMSYSPGLMISPLDRDTPQMDNKVFLGAKGYFLKKLKEYQFPVPPGFILTTELFRRRDVVLLRPEVKLELKTMIRGHLKRMEDQLGKQLGNSRDPLLLSVRSGAAISMPGAMNTFLNVGLNRDVVEELAHRPGFEWTAWDCYRRFLQSWGMNHGVNRDEFDQTIIDFKKRYHVEQKVQFNASQMKSIAMAYRDVVERHRITIQEDPFEQLLDTVFLVMESWYTERARVYRQQLQIAEDWGTAVIVQHMVLGNIDHHSGTGVVFTRNPHVQEPGIALHGDFTRCSQGEDVVGGLVYPLPISEEQRALRPVDRGISLEKDFPGIYAALLEYAEDLVQRKGFGHQELEFTFESKNPKDLYLLQTRDFIVHHEPKKPVFKSGTDLEVIGRGVGVGGGAMNGIVVFDMKDLEECSRQCPGEKRILVRPDTVPDDIDMIFECEGLLTSRGGATSHAALTAARLGKTCVVNCQALRVNEKEKTCYINGHEFRPGDRISIDGRLGHIYSRHYPIVMESVNL
jgi:pyruvate,orthophosphate dikinase